MSRRRKSIAPLLNFKVPPSFTGIVLGVLGFVGGYLYHESQTPEIFSSPTPIPSLNVCFSPQGRCENLVLQAISFAKQEIFVNAYSFTAPAIAQALIEAHRRGVQVRVLYDKRENHPSSHSLIPALKKQGIPVYVDHTQGLAHNKVMIIDQDILLVGSYNWSNAANTRNAENLLLIRDKVLADHYKANWTSRYQDSLEKTKVIKRRDP